MVFGASDIAEGATDTNPIKDKLYDELFGDDKDTYYSATESALVAADTVLITAGLSNPDLYRDLDKTTSSPESINHLNQEHSDINKTPVSGEEWNEHFKDKYGSNNVTWETEDKGTWGRPSTLTDHFERHGAAVGAINESDYVSKANNFYNNRNLYDVKIRANGDILVFDKSTGWYGAYNPDGTTKTLFIPDGDPLAYWNNQH